MNQKIFKIKKDGAYVIPRLIDIFYVLKKWSIERNAVSITPIDDQSTPSWPLIIYNLKLNETKKGLNGDFKTQTNQ